MGKTGDINENAYISETSNITSDDIKKEYIAPVHYTNLMKYLIHSINSSQASFPYIVSFRKTGSYSVLMLEAGAAAKPHSILDKTIKEGSITDEEKNCKALLLLYGLVAYREEIDGKRVGPIIGLYKSDSKDTNNIFRREGRTLPEFVSAVTGIGLDDLAALDTMDKKVILTEMAKDKSESKFSAKHYAQKYIAGDYDIHDLLDKVTQVHPVPSDSLEEFRALNDLNAIMTKRKLYSGNETQFIMDTYYPIQHGSQYNYIAHMLDKERSKEIVMAVAQASFPILMLNIVQDKIEWLEIKTLEDLKNYYDRHYAHIKSTWNPDFAEYVAKRQSKSIAEFIANIKVEVKKSQGYK
ncbi:MAG: hypothetical protein K2K46_00985 [Lachnospiraceae bacterium]|nr:hypothetical protein [Lachnospiraceae bacterium]